MKKCSDCNCEMIDDCPITGKHPYVSDFRQRVDISVSIPTGQKNSFPGIPCEAADRCELKARVCPKCGKVELYADLSQQR